ncbi:MAG: DegV family protein [Clostridia bacterium]|nr:DegV family protein [Clostridia bacterium]
MAILFCDTDCELWYTHANEYDLKVIRMPYFIDGEEKLADLGEETDIDDFFTRMRNGASASTAGLNQANYYEILKPYFEKGEDILYMTFSNAMSGTFQYLELALNDLRAEYPNVKYLQFDTKNICMGAGLVVYMGAKYCREHGDDIEATYKYLESIVDHIGIYFVVEDMKYLARGGRISPAKAKIGNFMQIKPVLSVDNSGKLDLCSKQNGMKKAIRYMLDQFDAEYKNIDGAPISILDAQNGDAAEDMLAKLKENHPDLKVEIWRQPVGPVIGAHAGPGTVGIIFTKA